LLRSVKIFYILEVFNFPATSTQQFVAVSKFNAKFAKNRKGNYNQGFIPCLFSFIVFLSGHCALCVYLFVLQQVDKREIILGYCL